MWAAIVLFLMALMAGAAQAQQVTPEAFALAAQVSRLVVGACRAGDAEACQIVQLCNAGDSRCSVFAVAKARQLAAGGTLPPDYSPGYPSYSAPAPMAPEPSYRPSNRYDAARERMEEERRRMQCRRDCSTFGNAYAEGGLDRIRECQASC